MVPDSANVKLVRELFANVNARNGEALIARVAPEAEMYTRIARVTGEPYRGREGVARWLSDTEEQFSEFSVDVLDIRDHENGNVVVEGRLELKGRGSELPWREDLFYVLRIDKGQLLRLHMYPDRQQAERMAARDF